MRRIVVVGGSGFFGRAVLQMLADRGIEAQAASRRAGSRLILDVEHAASLHKNLRNGDVVIDTVGPFQDRSTALIEAAMHVGCDVVDLSDSLAYAQRVHALRERIAATGIRVLTSCSSVSAVTSMLVAAAGIEEPGRVSGFLVPSTRYSASAATAQSLMRSVGRKVQVWSDGRLQERSGWCDTRRASFPPPIGDLQGHLFESADSFWLPRAWPSLHTADFYVDTRVGLLNTALSWGARSRFVRAQLERFQKPGHQLARLLGRRASCLAVEVEAPDRTTSRQAVYCPDRGYRLAVAPAFLAAQALAEGKMLPGGLISPPAQFRPEMLAAEFERLGFRSLAN